jgi:predicted ATPase/DNA-binding SARP family transcriptional activator/uncharacterized protein HemY
MSQLYMHLLGSPRIELDGSPLVVDRRKAIAILVYLVLTKQAHSRDTLATLFWPDYDQRSARANLRRTVSGLKQALGGEWLEISRESIAIEHRDTLGVDVERFENLLRSNNTHGHPTQEVCSMCLSNLKEAVSLYADDFLSGFTLLDSPGFDDWQLFQTEKMRRQLGEALERLVQGFTAIGDFKQAITYAHRWLGLDPLHEPAQRQMMRLLAWSGQHSAAVQQYQEFEQLLDEELGLPPEEETTHLYETIRARQLPPPKVTVSEHEKASSTELPNHNLPRQLTPFIGRKEELADIKKLLLDEPHCRLLTLVGAGGIGKTRLAIEATAQVQDAFPNGVYFVSLASVSQPEFIVPALGEALNINFQGVSDPKARVLAYLNQRRILLLIDNFEHLLDGAELLGEILLTAPEIKILVTSRERLNLHEEWVYEVQGLPFPKLVEITDGESPASMEDFDAVRLFLQNARRAKAGFSVSGEDIPAVVRLCQLVDGLPLGLELAAPWVRSMTCQEIVEEVEHNLDFLSTTLRNVPKRHRSLRAVYEQTWSRLPETEQTVLSKLSVFYGGFSREAAEQVAGASLSLLSSLVEKALLRRGRYGRYDMHELIRQFSAEQLQGQADNHEEALDRHAAYYADFLQQRKVVISIGQMKRKNLSEIAIEIDNIYAAWQRMVAQKNVEALDRSIESFHVYYRTNSLNHEVVATLRQATLAFIGSDNGEDGFDYEKAANLPNNKKSLVGYLLTAQGDMFTRIGWLNKGQALLEQGIRLQRGTEPRDKQREATSLIWLSLSFHFAGTFSKAEPILNEALELYTEVQDRLGMAWCMNRLGSAALQSGQPAEAERLLLESMKISDEVGDWNLGSVNRHILSMKAIDCGDYILAKELLDKADALIREEQDPFNWAGTMRERGRLFLAQGRYAQAAQAIQRSLELFDEVGSKWFKEATLSYLGSLYRQQDDFDKAERFYQQNLFAAEEVNHLKLMAHNLSGLGCVHFDRGQYRRAKQYQHKALDMYKELENEPEIASVFRHLGHISINEDEIHQADTSMYYQKALRLAKKHQLAPIALDVLVGWSYFLVQVDEKSEAVEKLTLAKTHPASTFETKEKAGIHLKELAADLPAEVYTAAQSRGQSLELWETTINYLEKLPEMG